MPPHMAAPPCLLAQVSITFNLLLLYFVLASFAVHYSASCDSFPSYTYLFSFILISPILLVYFPVLSSALARAGYTSRRAQVPILSITNAFLFQILSPDLNVVRTPSHASITSSYSPNILLWHHAFFVTDLYPLSIFQFSLCNSLIVQVTNRCAADTCLSRPRCPGCRPPHTGVSIATHVLEAAAAMIAPVTRIACPGGNGG